MHEDTHGQKDQHSFIKFCRNVYFLMPTVSEFWDMVPQFVWSTNMFLPESASIHRSARSLYRATKQGKECKPPTWGAQKPSATSVSESASLPESSLRISHIFSVCALYPNPKGHPISSSTQILPWQISRVISTQFIIRNRVGLTTEHRAIR